MSSTNLGAGIESARAYESLFVPALFGQWASRVADAAALKPGQRVLDVACGTGVLVREAASRVAPNGSAVGLDPNPGMLAVGAEIAPAIDWRQGVAESIPFPDESFDAVVCQFGLMFFSDRHRAIREMLRVLVPGGRLTMAVWDSLDNTPAYAADVALLERIAGTDAANALRAPFALGELQVLKKLFADAGVPEINITTLTGTACFPSLAVMLQADLRGWLPVMGVLLSENQIERVMKEAETVLGSYRTEEGTMEFESPAHLVSIVKAQ